MVDFKTKLLKKVDPRKEQMQALRQDMEQTARVLQEFHESHVEVFDEFDALAAEAKTAEDAFKAFVREDYIGRSGAFTVIDDDTISVTANTKWSKSEYDVAKLRKILGPIVTASLTRVVVDEKKLEAAVAEGRVDLEKIEEALEKGEQGTTAITVRLK